MSNNVAIIGGGAAGLVAAIMASKGGAKVDLFEKNSKVARKILASGNGRCNISNTNLSVHDYFGSEPSFAKFALNEFGFSAFEKFCKSLGLMLEVKDDGRVYPLSNEAKSVALLFENEAKRVGVNLILDTTVKSIKKESEFFSVESEDSEFEGYKKVLICCGSESYPSLGATADGYEFAKSFSHEVLDSYPSLVQLHVDSPIVQKVSGVKVDAVVTLFVDGLKEKSVSGDLLFTKYGVSGFSILDISQAASLALLYGQKVIISLNLLPKFDRQSLSTYISNQCKALKEHTFLTLLSGIISQKIGLLILDELHLSVDTLCSKIDTKVVKKVANMLLAWRFNVNETHGFSHSEVSGGGVSTTEINPHTMESKKCKDLYFAGEVLDIVGRRGGFNLHFAFATGFIAGKQLAKLS